MTSHPRSDSPAAGGRLLIIEDLDAVPEQATALFSICIAAAPVAPAAGEREQLQA
ncbi:hypothetical protein ACFXKG_36065 [Streptomyces sp. NPDC059255]|uniref:hypothetical protein n=1 Tax=Streptomyces sp. NPDC059255 TaxID=3346793 RepID=UPI0036C41B20